MSRGYEIVTSRTTIAEKPRPRRLPPFRLPVSTKVKVLAEQASLIHHARESAADHQRGSCAEVGINAQNSMTLLFVALAMSAAGGALALLTSRSPKVCSFF